MKCFSRWIKNKGISFETYFLPFAQLLLENLSHSPLHLVIDGSTVGRECMVLMVGVVYKKRALPIAWTVAKRKKGHFPENIHMELISRVEKMIPEETQVILLGDGEFDGIDLQALVNGWKWRYVFRTGKNIILCWNGKEFAFDAVADHVQPDEYFEIPDALFTNIRYGPVFVLTWWRKDCKEPIHLVSNMNCPENVCRSYAKRFRIETFFSDQKGRGFHLNKSHLSDPNRISKLLIAACLAYYWVIYLGASAIRSGRHHIIHRTDRCDLSLFQLGLRLLEYLIDEDMPIPTELHRLQSPLEKSVR